MTRTRPTFKPRPWVAALAAAAVAGGFLPAGPARAGTLDETTNDTSPVQALDLLVVRPADRDDDGAGRGDSRRLTFDLYEPQALRRLAFGQPASPTRSYASLRAGTAQQAVVIISIQDAQTLARLSPSDRTLLASLLKQGDFVGIGGDGTSLRQALGEPTTGRFGADVPYRVFTHSQPTGAEDDLELFPPRTDGDGEGLREVFTWATELLSAQPAALGNAWEADFTNRWKGTMSGGEYEFGLSVFKLITTSKQFDWYRVDTKVLSAINDFVGNGSRCGWFTPVMTMQVQANGGGQLWDHMPTGTLGSVTKGFEIGASLSGQTPGLSAGYSQSYGTTDVTITDQTSPVNNRATWNIGYNGPSYTWYPFYSNPAPVARSTYFTDPSLIVQVPKNSGLHISVLSDVVHQNDSLSLPFPWVVLYVTSHNATQRFSPSFDFP